MTGINRDGGATWIQLRDRLREIRDWAEDEDSIGGNEVLAILDRPRETLDDPEVTS